MGMRDLKWTFALLVAAVGFSSPNQAQAQHLMTGDNYSLTFLYHSGWHRYYTDVVSKDDGVNGLAFLKASVGTILPSPDSLAKAYAESMGGTITLDSNGTKTLGGRNVQWQEFKYDNLSLLSKQILDSVHHELEIKNGKFRAYYLQADGYIFTIAMISAFFRGTTFRYEFIEDAIATLKLGAQTGTFSLDREPGRDLWIRGGRVGGEGLKANRVFAVDCFDSRGVKMGAAAQDAEGTWILPASSRRMIVVLRSANGAGVPFTVHPR
jgi:hypothetical protein